MDQATGPTGATTLLVADFDDTEAAWVAYEALTSARDGRNDAVDGVVVVERGADGRLEVQQATDRSTPKGLTWGLVGGAALGILFPPSVLGSAAVLGGAGAAIGRARQRHHRSQLAERLEYAVAPGHSGIVAVLPVAAAPEVRAALAGANAVIESPLDDALASDIRALAQEGDSQVGP